MKDPRNIVAVILASTICAVVLATVIAALFRPPESITETFRVKIFELLVYIIGIVSGWLLRGDKEPSPKP